MLRLLICVAVLELCLVLFFLFFILKLVLVQFFLVVFLLILVALPGLLVASSHLEELEEVFRYRKCVLNVFVFQGDLYFEGK